MASKKHVACQSCDINCVVEAVVKDDGKIQTKSISEPHPTTPPNSICMKSVNADTIRTHKDRVLYPLKNVGSKRGEQRWERISWDQALDEIAEKLKKIIAKYGPESLGVSQTEINQQSEYGTLRRFMNLLGSPNWTAAMYMCIGNTAGVHRVTHGSYSFASFADSNCLLFIGKNLSNHNWVSQFNDLKAALKRGCKLIVLDPRRTKVAEMADIWLPLRYGTDAALFLGMINVIINEQLYDKEFVENWCVGFEELKERVQEYPLDKVAEITGCDAGEIRKAAVMFATESPASIPWAVSTDMQKNSCSAIRAQCILRAIVGSFVNGAEILGAPHSDLVPISKIQMHEALPEEKKKLQLGTETYPFLTYTGMSALEEPSERVYGVKYFHNMGAFMANPTALFTAMATEKPYPVKAFFALASNALMGYANQQNALKGLMNQDLVVCYDQFMTPTAQLADYVLPGDHWLERPVVQPNWEGIPFGNTSQQVVEPAGEAKDEYYFIRELAVRMGLEEHFPWKDRLELINYRISPTGMEWEEYQKQYTYLSKLPDYFGPEGVGVATPSGKVELYSSVFEKLGYDPLPYYHEPLQTELSDPELAKEYPLILFAGLREDSNFQSCYHQPGILRDAEPDPVALLHPKTAQSLGLPSGEWIWVETTHGRLKLLLKHDGAQPEGTIRIPHGRWCPEQEGGPETGFSGAMLHNDAMVLSDDDWNLDPEQGLPNLRGGILAKAYKC